MVALVLAWAAAAKVDVASAVPASPPRVQSQHQLSVVEAVFSWSLLIFQACFQSLIDSVCSSMSF